MIRDLMLRLRALITPRRVERDLHDELSFHVEREARKLMDQGVPPHEAQAAARARFGSVALVADECRDERGINVVDYTVRDVRFAFRSFRRAPLAALTIVGTVAIGLGVVAVLFTILNAWLFRVDAVPAVSEMYGVERQLESSEASQFTRPQFDALRKETHVFADAYAAVANVDVRVNGRIMDGTLVTGNFFQVVGVSPVMGRALTPADDDVGNPVIVLSDKGWRRHFDRDPHVLGRTLRMGTAQFDIVGVMPAGFRGLQFNAPDFWAPLPRLAEFRPAVRGREDTVGVEIIGRIRSGVSLESARAQIAAWDSNVRGRGNTERPNATIVLEPERGTFPEPPAAVAVFTPLFFVFGLVLLIGCANVANLLLARGVARQREIGIRLSLGASRWRIVRQLMTERCLLAVAAAGAAYLISRLALEGMLRWFSQAMPVDLGDPNIDLSVPAADWRVALFLVIGAIVATALFALLPALQATRIEPVRTLRGELVRDARPGRSRNALIGIQVFASSLLLVCAAIFLRSAIASSRFDPGFRTGDTVLIDIPTEPRRAAMLQAIASEPTITAHGAMRPHMMAPPFRAFAQVDDRRIAVPYKFVSPEYFGVFDISIVRGRAFTSAERDAGALVAIIAESTARALWPNGGGIGETLRLEDDYGSGPPPKDALPSRLLTVVGVARDVPGFRITDTVDVRVFLPTSVNAPQTSVVARIAGDPDIVRQTLVDRLTLVDPNMGMVVTMRTLARLETFFLRIAFFVSLGLGGLALVLTVTGLFSVLSYLVEQRRKEIGVRMALGASSRNVARLILAQTTRPVLYGLLAGAGLAASLAAALLSIPTGAMIVEVIRVNDPIAYVGSVLAILLACLFAAWVPASRAAHLDPMQAIRQD